MRFYEIVIRQNGKVFTPPSMQGAGLTHASYSSLTANRRPNPSALDCTINISAFFMSAPRQGSMVRLSGVSLADLSQITHLVDADIEVYAGMLDGYLPLSKHYSPDLLTRGIIWTTSGNWEGTNTTLDIYIETPTTRNPALGATPNLTFNWPVGSKLKPALQEFLDKAYGKSSGNPTGATIDIQISDDLTARSTFPGAYRNFVEFCTELKKFTAASFRTIKRLDNSPYRGVELFWRDNTIYAVDGTQPPPAGSGTSQSNPKPIKFVELIGQPTWKTFNLLNFKTIMRGDFALADYIKLPEGLNTPYVLTTPGSGSGQAPNDKSGIDLPSKDALAFSGVFQVSEIIHSGQFRSPRGNDWVTSIDCYVPAALKPVPPTTPEPRQPSGAAPNTEPPPGSIPTNPLRTQPPPPPSTTVLPPFVPPGSGIPFPRR